MCNHPGMEIRVLYFAAARDRAGGASEERLTLDDGATVHALGDALVARHPALGGLRRHLRFAVNEAFVRGDAPLADGDEVALIPPVSGG